MSAHRVLKYLFSQGIGCNIKDPADVVNFGLLVKVGGIHPLEVPSTRQLTHWGIAKLLTRKFGPCGQTS
jgi:hypothetical protein